MVNTDRVLLPCMYINALIGAMDNSLARDSKVTARIHQYYQARANASYLVLQLDI